MRVELRALTGIRAFAAIGVVLFHLVGHFPNSLGSDSILIKMTAFGSNGVDLFFMLSGFIITYSYTVEFQSFTWFTYRHFLYKRLSRIYPAHLFALGLLVMLGIALFITGRDITSLGPVTDLVQEVLMVNNWNPWDVRLSWNAPNWSISAEWSAYLLFPLLLVLVRSIPRRFLFLLVALLPLLMVLSYRLGRAEFGPVRIMTEFTCGIALYYIWQAMSPNLLWSQIGLLCAIIYIPIGILLGIAGINVRWEIILVPPLLLSLALNTGSVTRFFARPLPEYLGRVSYSLYITHFPVILGTRFIFLNPLVKNSLLLTTIFVLGEIVLVYMLAHFTYHRVEEPSRKWLTSITQRKFARTTV